MHLRTPTALRTSERVRRDVGWESRQRGAVRWSHNGINPNFRPSSLADTTSNYAFNICLLFAAKPTLDWLANASFAGGKPTTSQDDVVRTIKREEDREESPPTEWRLESDSDSTQKKKSKKEKKPKIEYKPNTIWLEESGLQAERAYRVDSKSDRTNYTYGSLYRMDVASFRRTFHKRCLGLENVVWDSDDESLSRKKRRRRGGNTEGRYCSQEAKDDVNVKRLKIIPSRTVTLAQERTPSLSNVTTFVAEDYLTLTVCSDDKSKLQLPEGSDRNDVATEGLSEFEEFTSKTKEFNETLREHPHDVATWLSYANFQTSQVASHDSQSRSKDQRVAEAERKAAILEKALMKNPRCVDLLEAHLETCSIFWDGDRIAQRWKEVVFKHPNSCRLWLNYAEFAQSRFSSFSFRSVQSIYHRCFSTLTNIVEGTLLSHPPETGTVPAVLNIFSSYCRFLNETGHSEKATACYQAQIEYNLFCPEEFRATPSSGQRAFLETFWDSGVPRFGQPGAKGWNSWHSKQKSGGKTDDDVQATTREDSFEPACSRLSRTAAWLETERHRERHGWLPWQGDVSKGETDDDVDDADRIVLYDDVSPSLFKFSDDAVKCDLVFRFVDFLRDKDASPMGLGHLNEVQSPVSVRNSLLYAQAIGNSDGLFHIGASSTFWIRKNSAKADFVREVFSQVQAVVVDRAVKRSFVLRWIDFELNELAIGGKVRQATRRTLKRKLKAILKEPANRNDLILWSAYALVECVAGNAKEAGQVLAAALQLATTASVVDERRSDDSSGVGLARAYRTYAELQVIADLDSRTSDEYRRAAISALVSFAEQSAFDCGTPVSATRILKAQKQFRAIATSSSESDSYKAEVAICSALLDYFTRTLDDVVANFLTCISSSEHFCRALVGLVCCHAQARPTAQSQVRMTLQEAVRLYPNSPQLLALYVELERSLHVITRRRRTLDHAVKSADTVVPWIVSILSEWQQARRLGEHLDEVVVKLPDTGFLNRIRSLLNRATEESRLQRNLLLWRLYMLFEVRHSSSEGFSSVINVAFFSFSREIQSEPKRSFTERCSRVPGRK